MRPDKIVISLPYYSARERSEYRIPEFLKDPDFCAGIIEVVRTDDDSGPGTKLLGALPSLGEKCCMILVDDDVIYHRGFLHRIADAQLGEHGASFSYFTYKIGGITIGQGCDGFSFWQPNLQGILDFFRSHVYGTNLVLHDDLWISVFLATRYVRVKSLNHLIKPGETIYRQSFEDSGSLRYLIGDYSRDLLQRKHLRRLLKEAQMPLSQRIKLKAGLQADYFIVGPSRRAYKNISNILVWR